MKLILPVATAAIISGCVGVQEAHRDLLHQIDDGFDTVEAALVDKPAALAVAKDLHADARALQPLIGKPANPAPYSPERSKQARDEAGESGRVWDLLAGLGTTLGALAWGILKTTQAGAVIDTLVTSVQAVREKAKAGALTDEDVKSALAAVHDKTPPVVKKRIEDARTRLRAKIAKAVPS